MRADLDTAIIGAGPYGLSISAQMRDLRLSYRIFGNPMYTWMNEMPKGMHLKSEGFASNIYDSNSNFTLKHFCRANALAYDDIGYPVPLDTFVSYGLGFQRKFVPEVEKKTLTHLVRGVDGFVLKLSDGELVNARRVVIAVGVTHFRYVPSALSHLPSRLLSHSAEYGELEHLRNRRVFVVGGGASAIDIAGLLSQLGADVHLFAREPELQIHTKLTLPRTMLERLRCPMSGMGPGWKSLFYAGAPGLFHYLPEHFRIDQAQRHLPIAGGWFMRKYIDNVPLHLGCRSVSAQISGNSTVALQYTKLDGSKEQLDCEHIIAATGYKVDVKRIPFLDAELLSEIKLSQGMPTLSADFQSSIPGLYFVGPVSANAFGPVLKFAVGAKFAAARLSKHFASTS